MRARRFQAGTIAEAYEQVRAALGDDAVIISTRQASAPGMFGFGKRDFVEVVAGLTDEPETNAPARRLVQDAAAHDLVRGLAERAAARQGVDIALPQEQPQRVAAPAARARASAATRAAGAAGSAAATAQDWTEQELAPPFVNTMAGAGRSGPFDVHARRASDHTAGAPPAVQAPPLPPSPLRDSALGDSAFGDSQDRELLASLAAGLHDVRSLVERIALERADETIGRGPAALADLRAQLIEQGVATAVLVPLLDKLAGALTADASSEAARQAVERRLAAQLPAPANLELARRPATVFIVGPSGSGKTTAAVRLGIHLANQRLRVTIAGTDVDRAGAPQQLQAYATAAGLRVQACYTPAELQAIIADGSSDVVIVDTPGHNGTRPERMAELQAFAQAARDRNVLLTLPATMQSSDLQRVTRAFASLQPRGLLLTRCDETETFGGLLSAVEQSGIGVAFTMHHDAAEEPPRAGDNHAFAAAVLNGRWPEPAAAASTWGKRAG